MADATITLTTDFGEDSPYVAAMKGVILGINPAVRLIDLSHQIPPQDVRHAAFFLAAAIPFFPAEVLHVVVVDPGVGSARSLLYVCIAGHRLLAPDNGCWTVLAGAASEAPAVYRLTESRYWRQPVSATFHGRDILAPVAAYLSLGIPAETLGQPLTEWAVLEQAPLRVESDRLTGAVEFIDHFGNLITNIPGDAFAALAQRGARVRVEGQPVPHVAHAYADAEPGTLLALICSTGTLEIAVNQGSAAKRLNARVGTKVIVAVQD